MSGPLQMYLYVHDSILRAVAGYEQTAKALDRDSAEDVSAFADELTWFHTMVKAHEHAEEQVLFPALEKRYSYISQAYAYDHDDFEPHVFDGIDAALEGLRRAQGNGDRKEQADLLYRQSVALNEHMRLHISKENELLVPRLESEFDLDEQAGIAGGMAGLFDPSMMGALVGWMYDGQSAEDREGMVRFLRQILPPETFGFISSMLAGRDAAAWSQLTARIPELAQSPSGP